MEKILMGAVLGWLGALLGSFVGAQVWRVRARQLVDDKAAGEPYDAHELSRLKPLLQPVSKDRSKCLHFNHTLARYDLIPLVSWLSLGGKCRYCHKRIGRLEPLVELGMAALFIISYLLWPHPLVSLLDLAAFTLWLVGCVLMVMLFVYDAKWSLLPFRINLALIAVAVLFRVIVALHYGFNADALISLVIGLGIMSGLYYLFSLFGWVGLGDSILGLGLGLYLGSWELAFLALFAANLAGSLMLIPLYLKKQLKRNMHVPFGPFMIIGTVIAVLYGHVIIEWVFYSGDTILNTLML
jgi:prepilin signal peptidase PulO-like enzyme (type II secretory pathway)